MKTDKFSEWGIASVLPGAQYILDRMQEEINYLKQVLQAHQESREEGLRRVAQDLRQEFGFEPKRRGRPPKNAGWSQKGAPPKGGWANMTAAERSAEMRRRRSLWNNPQAGAQAQRNANHPRNPDHPGHAAWLAKIRKAQKTHWNGMSAAQQKKQIKRMVAAKVNGAATEASA